MVLKLDDFGVQFFNFGLQILLHLLVVFSVVFHLQVQELNLLEQRVLIVLVVGGNQSALFLEGSDEQSLFVELQLQFVPLVS